MTECEAIIAKAVQDKSESMDALRMAQYDKAFQYLIGPGHPDNDFNEFVNSLELAANNGLLEAAIALADIQTKAYYPNASEQAYVEWLTILVKIHKHPESMIKLGKYLCEKKGNQAEGIALVKAGIEAAEKSDEMPLTFEDYGNIAASYASNLKGQSDEDVIEALQLATFYAKKGYKMASAETPALHEKYLLSIKKHAEAIEAQWEAAKECVRLHGNMKNFFASFS